MTNALKIKNPYMPDQEVLVPPDTIGMQRKSAAGKAKASYPDKPLGIGTKGGASGIKHRALTPGTSPAGS